jgi:hypothetical protein
MVPWMVFALIATPLQYPRNGEALPKSPKGWLDTSEENDRSR